MGHAPTAFMDVAMRTISDIRLEIEELTERRSELWHRLSTEGHSSEATQELAELNERIEHLWDEHRELRARMRFGDREEIIARARAEERLNRAA
jgi:FtsZ-binding cell division protein ZapB